MWAGRPAERAGVTAEELRCYVPALEDRRLALREMGIPSLLVLVDYLELLAEVRPDQFDRAAVRWHGSNLSPRC